MKATIENVQFYIDLLNAQGNIQIELYRANETNYIVSKIGRETIFNGSLSECYYFLVGAQKLVNSLFNDYTVNGNYRVYQIVDSLGRNYFCNITDLNRVVEQNSLKAGYFTIFHFWNNKAKKVSKKDLKSFFEGSQLKQQFEY